MPAPPAWKPVVTLVPFSGVQFLDFAFNIDDTPRLQRSFLERSDPARRREDGSQIVKLEPLTGDPERDAPILDPPRDGDDLYEVSKIRALEPFLGKWTPVPVLRVRPGRGEMGEELLDTGPTTWARLRVSACDETIAGGRISHRVVLAFDTELAERVPQRPYLAPSFQDATDGQEFRFAPLGGVAWFLAWPEPETMGGQDVQSWVTTGSASCSANSSWRSAPAGRCARPTSRTRSSIRRATSSSRVPGQGSVRRASACSTRSRLPGR